MYSFCLMGGKAVLTIPQNCGRQAGWVLRVYKKPFNYVCLVRLKVRVEIEATACALLRNTMEWLHMDSWKEKESGVPPLHTLQDSVQSSGISSNDFKKKKV